MIDILNEYGKRFRSTGTADGIIMFVSLPPAASRKARKALTSRRWDKKFIRCLRGAGFNVMAIQKMREAMCSRTN